jgi:hypothetical protein
MMSELNYCSILRFQTVIYSALSSTVAMGCVQSQELEEKGYPFPLQSYSFDASLGKVVFNILLLNLITKTVL